MSSFFDDLGSTIYNLVFVVFAASIANSKLAVGVASFIQYIPTICALFIAMQADKTKNKKLWLLLVVAIIRIYTSSIIYYGCVLIERKFMASFLDCMFH